MKISGVNISGGIRLDPPVAPTPSGPSKFVVGSYKDDDTGSASGSAYVYNTDGTGEVKITVSDGAANDQFGWSVAISDTKVLVSSRVVDSQKGAAYLYNPDGSGEVKIMPSDGAAGDRFGDSIAISNTKIGVGASHQDDPATHAGAVYIYNTDGTGELKIKPSDAHQSKKFGSTVAISDTKIAVGADQDSAGSTKGAAYLYNLDGTGEVKIVPSDSVSGDNFCLTGIALSDTKIVGGARGHNSYQGAAYLYNLDGSGEVKITASDGAANDRFGWSVDISDTHIVVGAPYDDDAGGESGSVYVYNTDGTGEVKITASDGAAGDYFGQSVAIQGDKIIVGAQGDDDNGSMSGAVYVYNLDGTGEQKITPSDGAADDRFGYSVALN